MSEALQPSGMDAPGHGQEDNAAAQAETVPALRRAVRITDFVSAAGAPPPRPTSRARSACQEQRARAARHHARTRPAGARATAPSAWAPTRCTGPTVSGPVRPRRGVPALLRRTGRAEPPHHHAQRAGGRDVIYGLPQQRRPARLHLPHRHAPARPLHRNRQDPAQRAAGRRAAPALRPALAGCPDSAQRGRPAGLPGRDAGHARARLLHRRRAGARRHALHRRRHPRFLGEPVAGIAVSLLEHEATPAAVQPPGPSWRRWPPRCHAGSACRAEGAASTAGARGSGKLPSAWQRARAGREGSLVVHATIIDI